MNAEEYRRRWSSPSGFKREFHQPTAIRIPANIEIREWSEPCGYCGVRPDVPCKHKAEVAA